MDQELIAYLDRRFAQNEETTRDIVEETTHRIVDQATQRLEGQIRQTQVMVEHLRSDLETVAEGVVDMNGKFDRHREENEHARREDRAFPRGFTRSTEPVPAEAAALSA